MASNESGHYFLVPRLPHLCPPTSWSSCKTTFDTNSCGRTIPSCGRGLPVSACGNKYAMVFMDYLTRWLEVFPAKDQSAYTIIKTLVEKVIPRHEVLAQLFSDRGAAFLSKLLAEVYHLIGMKKVNTTRTIHKPMG